MRDFDAIVIGAGQSGPFLAARLAGAGQKVALIERRGLGGTCVNDGCIPTKTLVASARAAYVAREARRFGVLIDGPVRVDMAAVKARKDAVVAESRKGLQDWLGNLPNLTLIHGHARFEDPRTVRVGDERLTARRFFLNTGARAAVPEPLRAVPHLTNSSMMDVDFLPEHLLVVGGSYVALEFAQMYRRFGSQVTVIERGPRLLSREDDDVSAEILEILQAEGITVHCNMTIATAAQDPTGALTLRTSGPDLRGSHLLCAVGRVPNSHDLGLDKAGVRCDARGYIQVDDELRTSAPEIYATGDVNGRGAFTHTSYDDFQIALANLLGSGGRKVSQRIPIYGLYIDPPLGRCGMTAAEARASGRKVLIGRRPMSRVGRAKERGETRGFMQILADADTHAILGATILGVEGDEAIHGIVDMMYAGAPYELLMRAVHAHPTVSELIPTVLEGLAPLP